MTLKVTWVDRGLEPKSPPDPAHPNGIDVNMSAPGLPGCAVALPYPAKRCGYHVVICEDCGRSALVSTAGRPDDPRSVTVACKKVMCPYEKDDGHVSDRCPHCSLETT